MCTKCKYGKGKNRGGPAATPASTLKFNKRLEIAVNTWQHQNIPKNTARRNPN